MVQALLVCKLMLLVHFMVEQLSYVIVNGLT